MTHFPHQAQPRPATSSSGSLVPGRQSMMLDVLWGRPLFKAPSLPNRRVAFDPLPFTATRITHRSR